jgi:hypothetical protein
VEPALGEKREETLRMAGIKTFFIVKALKPVSTNVNTGIYRNIYASVNFIDGEIALKIVHIRHSLHN